MRIRSRQWSVSRNRECRQRVESCRGRFGREAAIARSRLTMQLRPMTKFSLIFSAAALLSATTAAAAQPANCGLRWGVPAKPLVASAQTATDIFLAVEREFFPRADKAQYPDVGARDEGTWWSVSRGRNRERDRLPNGEFIITSGGGQLSMRIDKCTGAISHVLLTR